MYFKCTDDQAVNQLKFFENFSILKLPSLFCGQPFDHASASI